MFPVRSHLLLVVCAEGGRFGEQAVKAGQSRPFRTNISQGLQGDGTGLEGFDFEKLESPPLPPPRIG